LTLGRLPKLARWSGQRPKPEQLRNPETENPAARFLGGISERTGLTIGSQKLKIYSKRPLKNQLVSDLPLFSWRVVVLRPATPAGRFVAGRYRVHPAFADLVANLAGIGSGVDR
jgi:hypothetical protein